MTTAIDTIRNVAIISHGGGGKTTLTETLLFNGEVIRKRGSVEKGDTVTSNEPEETERGITITPHMAHLTWQDRHIHLIDTPGYINFLEATRGVLSVVGGGVLMISGASGIKPEDLRLWNMAQEASLPLIGFINKLDRPRSDFIRALGEVENALGVTTLPASIPIGVGDDFEGIVDLIPMTAWSAKDGKFTQIDMPDSVKDDVEHYRAELVEKIVEGDDDLLEKYLEGEEPNEEQLHQGLKEAVITGRLFCVFCGSALANIGVRALAWGIARYLPTPLDKAAMIPLIGHDAPGSDNEVSRNASPNDPLSAVVFKTTVDPFSGKLSFVRVFSGVLNAGKPFYNGTKQVKEKGGHLFKAQGKELVQVDKLETGEIGAVAKLEFASSGDTLCDESAPIHYSRVKFIEPILSYAVEAEGKTEDKVAAGLGKLAEEDQTMRFYRDEQTREMILAGMGQTHLEVVLARLKRKYGSVATLKTPKVPYRETIKKGVRVQGKLKKQTGGHGQFADCWIEMDPLPRGTGFEFVDSIVGGVIPRQFIPSVEKGIREAMGGGVLAGYPVVDFKVNLVDGSHHSVDSSDFAFKVAGSMALKKGMEEAGAVLLEPVMTMEITAPEEAMGDVIGDLNSRRGKVTGVTPKAGSQVIEAETPMAEVLEYGNVLNSLTAGRGLYTMALASYQEVPSHIARKVIEKQDTEG